MSTYVRIQDRKYGTEGLFDADRLSWDMGMCDDNARHGVSCCVVRRPFRAITDWLSPPIRVTYSHQVTASP